MPATKRVSMSSVASCHLLQITSSRCLWRIPKLW